MVVDFEELNKKSKYKDKLEKSLGVINNAVDKYGAPIPIVRVIEDFGINAYHEEMSAEKVSLFYANGETSKMYEGNDKVIVVNESMNLYQKRVAAARELAYYIYELYGEKEMLNNSILRKDEYNIGDEKSIYDDLAIELLIPNKEFFKWNYAAIRDMESLGYIPKYGITSDPHYYLTNMSEIFKVPKEIVRRKNQKIKTLTNSEFYDL